jgi:hypothetical protein
MQEAKLDQTKSSTNCTRTATEGNVHHGLGESLTSTWGARRWAKGPNLYWRSATHSTAWNLKQRRASTWTTHPAAGRTDGALGPRRTDEQQGQERAPLREHARHQSTGAGSAACLRPPSVNSQRTSEKHGDLERRERRRRSMPDSVVRMRLQGRRCTTPAPVATWVRSYEPNTNRERRRQHDRALRAATRPEQNRRDPHQIKTKSSQNSHR